VAYPSKTAIVSEVSPGVAKLVSYEVWQSIPEWNWNNIFNLFGVDMPPAPPSKAAQKRARQAANAEWWAKQSQTGASSSSTQ
jgi:hypothetical protein